MIVVMVMIIIDLKIGLSYQSCEGGEARSGCRRSREEQARRSRRDYNVQYPRLRPVIGLHRATWTDAKSRHCPFVPSQPNFSRDQKEKREVGDSHKTENWYGHQRKGPTPKGNMWV